MRANAAVKPDDPIIEMIEIEAVTPISVETNTAPEPKSEGSGEESLPIGNEPVFAYRVETPAASNAISHDSYRLTNFGPFADEIDPEKFYETNYDTVLIKLIHQVLATEAPIAENLLIQRIARAHGFQRSGRII